MTEQPTVGGLPCVGFAVDRPSREDAREIAVEMLRELDERWARATVVFGDGVRELFACEVVVVAGHHRILLAEFLHQALDIEQLGVAAPITVRLTPVRARRQPHRERLRKILVGMLLGVPARDVTDEVAGEGSWRVLFQIRLGE